MLCSFKNRTNAVFGWIFIVVNLFYVFSLVTFFSSGLPYTCADIYRP